MSLYPGDVLKVYRSTFIDWTAATVVAIDRGDIRRGNEPARPAKALLLVDGPRLIERDFTWIARNCQRVAYAVPGP